MNSLKNVFILTASSAKYGLGHFKRSLFLQDQIIHSKLILYQSPSPSPSFTNFNNYHKIVNYLVKQNCRILILDKRESPFFFLKALKKNEIITIAFDSQGKETFFYDYLITTFPSLKDDLQTNLHGSTYLNLNLNLSSSLKPKKKKPNQLLIYLGSTTSFFYLLKIVFHLKSILKSDSATNIIIVVKGSSIFFIRAIFKLFFFHKASISFSFIKPTNSFKDLLRQSSLLICHYGFCVFEALHFQVPFVLVDPTSYHKKLSKKHFKDFIANKKNINRKDTNKLLKVYKSRFSLGDRFEVLIKVINEFKKETTSTKCPICFKEGLVIMRRSWMNLHLCRFCDYEYMRIFGFKKVLKIEEMDYGNDYFLSEYEKNYGKTYVKDKQNIINLSRGRVKTLSNFLKETKNKTLLEIGCAYGYFLDVVKEEAFFQTEGVEISKHAALIASKKHLVYRDDFLSVKLDKKVYDVIVLWFVIEHFMKVDKVIEKMSQLQKKGGLIGLSTPNGRGFSARFNRNDFLKNSPVDHYHIFSKKSLERIFKKHGYRFLKLETTGIHYKRFRNRLYFLSWFISKKRYFFFAKKFNLGDTNNFYFIKNK